MARLIARKLILMVLILVALNYVAYHYAVRHPGLLFYPFSNITDPEAELAGSQYPAYVQAVLRGDLGEVAGTPVTDIIREPIRNSLVLLAVAMLTTIVVGSALGFLSISPRTWRLRRAPGPARSRSTARPAAAATRSIGWSRWSAPWATCRWMT